MWPASTLLVRLAIAFALLGGPALAQGVRYNRQVRPILSDNCFRCHGPDAGQRKAGLRLDDAAGAYAQRKHGAAIVPGKPERSLLVARISAPDPKHRMPPPDSHKHLSAEQIATLIRWIEGGAVYEAHWADTPVRVVGPPEVADETWASSTIDRWIYSRLAAAGLRPSPEADRTTLIRRLSFDLIGLPPTPEQVADFLSDTRPDASERVVDRLLSSPHYGERMAIYWLDLVRYADTVGYHGDQEHPIQPYREWVIEAFNANMPFDRFTTEQLAGDLLPEPTIAQKVATGYNRVLQTTHEGGAQAKEYLAIYAADRVRNFGSVWLAATIGCAQCHDHKYDPLLQRDFYSLAAFFADIEEKGDFKGSPNKSPTTRPPEMKLPDGRRTMITVARKKPRITRVLARGNWMDDTGEIVSPAVPAAMEQIAVKPGKRATRLELAHWLVSGHNPRTARVFVNRLWYLFFGRGLAPTLDDFGAQGKPPEHPELLDALAHDFVRGGWDIKRIVREIVTSRAYRQSSLVSPDLRRRDPSNALCARQGSWRLPAEMIRDNALAISGLLVTKVGGNSIRPYQPAGYYRHLNFPPRRYKPDIDERQWRRGVYMHWQRMFLHPALKAFDAPTREECTAERPVSNTPQAALTLLNDPTFVEAARVFAARCIGEVAGDPARIQRMGRLATSRALADEELELFESLLARERKEFHARPAAADKLLRVGLKPVADDIDHVELAAWTEVGRVLMNLDETITRN